MAETELEYVTRKAHEMMPLPVTEVSEEHADGVTVYKIVMDASAVRDDVNDYKICIEHRDDVEREYQLRMAAQQCFADVDGYIQGKHKGVPLEEMWLEIRPREFERISDATGCEQWREQAARIREQAA